MSKGFTTSDEFYIASAYRKNPEPKTIVRLAKYFQVEYGDISRILAKFPDIAPSIVGLREANKRQRIEANKREAEKLTEIRNRKQEAQDGQWVIPQSISKSVLLKVTPKQAESLTQLSFGVKAFIAYVTEAVARKMQIDYDLIKKFCKKNQKLPAKMLDVVARTKAKTMIQSSIRKPHYANFTIPFQGTHGNTSGNAKVVLKNGKFYLVFNKMNVEILFQDNDDYYDSRLEKPLRELFTLGETPSGEILKARNGNWYARFSLKRKPSIITFDNNSPRIFLVVQPIFTQIGCKWLAYFYDQQNHQIFKITILRDVAWMHMPITQKNYIGKYVAKAVNQLIEKTWHRRFMTSKPIVVILDPEGQAPSQEVSNLNPTYKLRFKLCDKLAEYNGDGYTLGDCPNNIEEIRARLSI